jgi:hypothetical protein
VTNPSYTFSHNWFNNLTAKIWQAHLLPHKPSIQSYLEVGVCEAQSLVWVLENLLDGKPHGMAVGVDPFLDSRNWHKGEGDTAKRLAFGNLSALTGVQPVRTEGTPSWTWITGGRFPAVELITEPSQLWLKKEHREFDLAYVDGNHDAPNALLDILLCFNLLRVGGILVIDDYDRRQARGGRIQVQAAVQAFEDTHHGLYDELYRHYKQVAFVKQNRRRRGEYPPMLVAQPCIIPDGPTGDE